MNDSNQKSLPQIGCLDSNAEIIALGLVTITSIGEENVYLTKDGRDYYFKPGSSESYSVGQHDFRIEPDPLSGSVRQREPSKRVLIMGAGRNRSAILAALRFYQREGQGDPAKRGDDIEEIASSFGMYVPLNDVEIDDLCEYVNMASGEFTLQLVPVDDLVTEIARRSHLPIVEMPSSLDGSVRDLVDASVRSSSKPT